MLRFFLIYLCFLLSINGLAQKRSARKLFQEAEHQSQSDEAIKRYQKVIAKDSTYSEAYLALALHYQNRQQYRRQIEVLETARKHCRHLSHEIDLQLSKASYLSGDYQRSKTVIFHLEKTSRELEHLEKCIDFSLEATRHPREFEAFNLGENLNTQYHDYWPSLSIDNKEMITTVLVEPWNQAGFPQEDFFLSQKKDGAWSRTKALSQHINTDQNEGAQSLSADGNTLLFTACDRTTGMGACDIYIARRENGVWSSPHPLPSPINTRYWEGHPSLSADGTCLYFSSDREGGYGGRDIYLATITLGENVIIHQVKVLDDKINTAKDEISPFIHADKQTLYFSSNGHVGLGRQDIFVSRKNHEGHFQNPVNLGYPINTHHDEIGLIVNAKGSKAYFSGERPGSKKKDIYSFDIPPDVSPKACTYFQASIKDKNSGTALPARVEVREISSGNVLFWQENTTAVIVPLSMEKDYAINVTHPHYLFFSEHFSIKKSSNTPLKKEICLSPIQSGERLILKNILFKHDSYELDTSFMTELEKTTALIKNNPQLSFEISGHTDSVGTAEYNQVLSEQRAKTIYQYLIKQFIKPERLSYKGYGNSRPISQINAENRRTEVLIR